MPKSFDSIEAMLDRFDFEKVQAIFALRGRSYFDNPGTPLLEELKNVARRVCENAIKSAETNELGYSQCGRFVAVYSKSEGDLELMFIGESDIAYV
jgi:hypothetical protein